LRAGLGVRLRVRKEYKLGRENVGGVCADETETRKRETTTQKRETRK
jgi:hypothetical protein